MARPPHMNLIIRLLDFLAMSTVIWLYTAIHDFFTTEFYSPVTLLHGYILHSIWSNSIAGIITLSYDHLHNNHPPWLTVRHARFLTFEQFPHWDKFTAERERSHRDMIATKTPVISAQFVVVIRRKPIAFCFAHVYMALFTVLNLLIWAVMKRIKHRSFAFSTLLAYHICEILDVVLFSSPGLVKILWGSSPPAEPSPYAIRAYGLNWERGWVVRSGGDLDGRSLSFGCEGVCRLRK